MSTVGLMCDLLTYTVYMRPVVPIFVSHPAYIIII